jgi:hypothetical protein
LMRPVRGKRLFCHDHIYAVREEILA